MNFVLISIETNLDGAENVVHLASCSLQNLGQVGNEVGLMLSQVSAKYQSNTRTTHPFASGLSLSSSVHRVYRKYFELN